MNNFTKIFTPFLCLLASADVVDGFQSHCLSKVPSPSTSSTALSSAELVDAFIPVYTLAAPAVLVSMYQASLPPDVSLYEKLKEAKTVAEKEVEAVPAVTTLAAVSEEPVVEAEAVPVAPVAVEVTKEEVVPVKVEVTPTVTALAAVSEEPVVEEEAVPVAPVAVAATKEELVPAKVEVAPAVVATTSTDVVAETAVATTQTETSKPNPNVLKAITQLLRALYFPWLGMVPRLGQSA